VAFDSTYTISVPSGDHDGSSGLFALVVMGWALAPSASMTLSFEPPS
jgi:hypothetical protein